jgi:hypothetical protein
VAARVRRSSWSWLAPIGVEECRCSLIGCRLPLPRLGVCSSEMCFEGFGSPRCVGGGEAKARVVGDDPRCWRKLDPVVLAGGRWGSGRFERSGRVCSERSGRGGRTNAQAEGQDDAR